MCAPPPRYLAISFWPNYYFTTSLSHRFCSWDETLESCLEAESASSSSNFLPTTATSCPVRIYFSAPSFVRVKYLPAAEEAAQLNEKNRKCQSVNWIKFSPLDKRQTKCEPTERLSFLRMHESRGWFFFYCLCWNIKHANSESLETCCPSPTSQIAAVLHPKDEGNCRVAEP